jgi:hypothetical protein
MDLSTLNRAFSLLSFFFPFLWFLIIFIFAVKKKEHFRKIIIAGIALFFLIFLSKAVSETYLQYHAWENNPVSKFLLPPYTPIGYFYQYCFLHFFSGFCLTLGGAIFTGLLFWFFQKKNYVNSEEALLAVMAALFSGWPNLIIFLVMTLILAILYSLLENYMKGIKKRVFLLFPIIISLILTLVFGNFLINHIGMAALRMPT